MRTLPLLTALLLTVGCGQDDSGKAPNANPGTGGHAGNSSGGSSSGGATSGGSGGVPSSGGGGASSGGASAGTGSGGTGAGGGAGSAACAPMGTCTLFVSPSGSDDGAGTEAQPFGTPQKAVEVAGPGDTICLRAGTYTDGVKMDKSGEPGAPITLMSYPGETAVFDGGGVAFFAGWGVAVGHLVLYGVEVKNVSDNALYLHAAHDVVIRGNNVHDNPHQGLLGNGLRVLIDGNVFAKNGYDLDDPWCNPGCYNKYHGIYGTGTEWTVVNNVFHSNTAYGVQVAGYPWDANDPNHPPGPEYMGASGWIISNNVFAMEMYRPGIVFWQDAAKDGLVQNNIFFQNSEVPPYDGGANGIDFYHSGAGHVVRNNIYFGSGQAIADTANGASYTETGAQTADPKFVDVTSFDFHLSSGSPGENAGVGTSSPDHDADCVSRPSGGGIDIGAYEK